MIDFDPRLALTFDDVFDRPRLLGGPSERRGSADPALPRHRSQHPHPLRRHGHGDRVPSRDRPGPGGRARHHPQEPLDRGPGRRGRQGQAQRGRDDRRSGDLRPDQSIREALEVMARYKISGVPRHRSEGHLVGILTNRDLRFEKRHDKPIGELMTKENLVTVPEGTTLEQAKAHAPQAPHREAAGRGPRRQPQGADHGQGHPEGDASTRTPARTSSGACGWAPPSAPPATILERPRRWSRPRWTSSCSTPRMPTATASSTRRRSCGKRFPEVEAHRAATWPRPRARSP